MMISEAQAGDVAFETGVGSPGSSENLEDVMKKKRWAIYLNIK